MYGGYPGALREDKGSIAELPFQWVSGRVSEVSDDAITLEPDFEKMQWQGLETLSGGPVFKPIGGCYWNGLRPPRKGLPFQACEGACESLINAANPADGVQILGAVCCLEPC